MLISLLRTAILLLAVVLALRLMGKRQIGQLQPSELVITILLSQIAATPMQENDIPAANTLAIIALLAGFEVLSSAASMSSRRLRRALDGVPVLLIRNGVIIRSAMKRLRYTLDDVLEALRQKDVFDVSDVAYAVVETNGSLSVLLKPAAQPVTRGQTEKEPKDGGMPFVLLSDGELLPEGLCEAGVEKEEVARLLRKRGVRVKDVFLLTCNREHEFHMVRREETE